ncbi:acid protease [Chiua virens]|nr:acid protease [Chiua virens]
MMFSSQLFKFVLSIQLCFVPIAFAVPNPSESGRQSITLTRRPPTRLSTVDDWSTWAKAQRDALAAKYGTSSESIRKRAQGTNLITNMAIDGRYVGSLAIGTPPKPFYVTLDTGSLDLWVASVDCYATKDCSDNVTVYNPRVSSTYQNLSQPFEINYALGNASGYTCSDVVQMARFSVEKQTFGVISQFSEDLVSAPVSGLLGLAWRFSKSVATPFWQTLASEGVWTDPVMAFHFTRFKNVSDAQLLEPGGSFTMGFVNSSLYTGNIDYQNLVGTPRHWTLPLTQLTVNGNNVSLPSRNGSLAAIDTGTTLVVGPHDALQDLYAQIPGSQPGSGDLEGFWTYPCGTQAKVEMTFGGKSWPIDPADFQFLDLGSNTCVGAFFGLHIDGDVPGWIVGDTFLKNVYSVYRYDPPSVGFATLSATAVSMNGAKGPPPVCDSSVLTPTLGYFGRLVWRLEHL